MELSSLTTVRVAAGIILQSSPKNIQQVLIAKRPQDKHQGGLWEFPGGKVEPTESAEQALARELKEELNISIGEPVFFKQISFDYGDKLVCLDFFQIEQYQGEALGCEGQVIRWVALEQLANYTFPEANWPIVDLLLNRAINK